MRKTILAAAIAALCAAPTVSLAATKIDDPIKFVTATYAKIRDAAKVGNDTIPEDIYTPRLSALVALDQKEAGGEVGRLDFEFWTNSQDWQLSNIKITGHTVEGAKDREVVIAKFKNIDNAEEIHFYFEKTKAGWLLDDAASVGKGQKWTLSIILKYGWDDEKG
jgi:hypothetical protein